MTLVKAIGPVLPEFNPSGLDSKTRPVRRPRNCLPLEFLLELRNPFFEISGVFDRLALNGRPGANLTESLTGSEIRIGLFICNFRHSAFDSYLNLQRRPMKTERSLGVREEMPALAALIVGVENESTLIERLEQNNSDRWLAPVFDRGEGHRVGIRDDLSIELFGQRKN